MQLRGKKVILIPIKFKERIDFYNLATKSYGSRFWYDEETKEKKTKKAFFKSWHNGYFNPKKPKAGKCFWIIVTGEKIGAIVYNKIDSENKTVELDIIIGERENMEKGHGSDALKTMIRHLFKSFDLNKIWIGARANNTRAVNAYKKAGFKKEAILRETDFFEGKFVNCIIFGILRRESSTGS